MPTLLSLALWGCEPAEPPCRADVQAWEDLDGDGFGGADLGLVCALGEGQVDQGLDCDDTDPEIHPEARERCNQADDNCDGEVDEGTDRRQFWQDTDGDGFAGLYPSQLACERPGDDWHPAPDDCDDTDPEVSPGGQEVCGGGDEDCDGLLDEYDDSVDPASFTAYFRDADGDGSGDPDASRPSCHLPRGFVDNADDCDDADPTFEFLELFDDADGDGYGDPTSPTTGCRRDPTKSTNGDDCDDTDPDILDARDWFEDLDGDGYGAGPALEFGCSPSDPDLVGFGGDCAVGDPGFHPGVPEVCDDGIDQNCDAEVDCADPQCVGAAGCQPPCAEDTLTDPAPFQVRGSTVGAGNDSTPTTCGFSQATDVIFWFVPDQTRQYTLDTGGSTFDTILYVKDGCNGRELACNDDFVGLGLSSQVTVALTAGVGVLVVVDGYSAGAGNFTLNVR